SSSQTDGPMKAARTFIEGLAGEGNASRTASVSCDLYGSLALTGKGHGSDTAVILGLLGETPEGVDVDAVPGLLASVRETGRMRLGAGGPEIDFVPARDVDFRRKESLPGHPN